MSGDHHVNHTNISSWFVLRYQRECVRSCTLHTAASCVISTSLQ